MVAPLASALALAIYGGGALAQDFSLEEIVVTAQKKLENLQDVPIAVQAFSADDIQEAGINSANDVAVMTPSLHVTSNTTPFNSRLAIRGIGTAQNDPALEPSVGMFVDGVFLGRSGLGMSDLADIERIEVLQGPQGTLYGKNTNAGAISVTTKGPNMEEFEGYVETAVGDYDMYRMTVSATGPLSDTLAYRLSGNMHQRDGYIENTAGNDLNNADDWNIQGKLLWEPSENLSLMLSGSHVARDTTCCAPEVVLSEAVQAELAAQGLPQGKNDPFDYEVANDQDTEFKLKSDLLSLQVAYDLGWGAITSITAWSDYSYTQVSDLDGSQLDIFSSSQKFLGDSISQEFRLDSSVGENIEYQVGMFYYEQTTQRGEAGDAFTYGDDIVSILGEVFIRPILEGINPVLGSRASVFTSAYVQPGDTITGQSIWDNDTLALFGQATWHAGERWHLTAGLRWTEEEREAQLLTVNTTTAPGLTSITSPPASTLAAQVAAGLSAKAQNTFVDLSNLPIDAKLDRSSENLDWLLKAAYDMGEETMVYASVSTGSKSGNFNGVGGTVDEREFDDETTLSYELGLKSTLLDSRLRLNAAAFLTQIDDFQSQQGNPNGPGTIVGNEGEVEVSGLDLHIDALPLPNLTLSAGLLYMDKYEITGGDREGDKLAYTADYTANLAATLVFPVADGNLYLRGDYMYMDEHATSPANSENLEAKDFNDRKLLNAKIGWRNDNWNLSIWAKNLTGDDYATSTTRPQIYSGHTNYFLAAPRTFGATVRYDY
jgi:iron complex outermembrane receptor protein